MEKTEIEILAEALIGYRGVNGRYDREDDEGGGGATPNYRRSYTPAPSYSKPAPAGGPVKMIAKFPGRCAQSGAAIEPGDTVQFNPQTRTRILLQKGGQKA